MATKKKEPATVVAVKGVAPSKGQLPAGLLSWLKANGRLKNARVVQAKAVKTTTGKKRAGRVQVA